MESDTLSPDAAPEQQSPPPAEPIARAELPNSTLFESSGEVHVGIGAADCELRQGECADPAHFHGWVCLPNPFQIRDIGDKARAAKARKIRALKDAGDDTREASDSYVTLEAALEEAIEDEYDDVVEEIVNEKVSKGLATLYAQLKEDEEWENHDQDMEHRLRLQATPEDQRDAEELAQLDLQATRFQEALSDRVEREKDRERDGLRGLQKEEISEILRAKRIAEVSGEAFLNAYYAWLMFVGTRSTCNHNVRKFDTMATFRMTAPEVVTALRAKVRDLENKTEGSGDGGSGNS